MIGFTLAGIYPFQITNFYSLSECQKTDETTLIDVDNEIDIPMLKKSKIVSDFNTFFASFTQRLTNLRLTDKTNNALYELCGDLVKNTQIFNVGLIEDECGADPKNVLEISSEFICSKLNECSTAKRRKKKCEQSQLYVPPQELSLGLKWEMLRDKMTKITTPQLNQCKFQWISIVDTVSSCFEREDFRKVYWEYNLTSRDHVCVEGVFKDVCCGKLYKENQLFSSDQAALRIHISNDDFEICNPLGSKATIHKLSAFYFTIENVPPQFRSKSKNIFLFCLCYADDLKTKFTDINDIWQLVVRDISFLEKHGITVDGVTVKGSLALLSFDNLGINQAFGLVACFRAQFFCRFCEMPIKDCRSECRENPSKRRTVESYNEILDCIENSTKVDFKDSRGIKMKCLLNELQYFHILKNLSVDAMHDLNEGVVPFALNQLFRQLIRFKILSEEELVQKIQYFDYGFSNQRNIPSILSFDKSNLGQNASQSGCLLRHVPFIFWKYRECAKVKDMWQCIKSLLRIFCICYSPEITQTQIDSLREEIFIHLTCLKDLGLSFIAKHHFLTHYPTIIEQMGPVVNMCMFKFERQHKFLKSLMQGNSNFTNVTYTIARKHQEYLSVITDSFEESFVYGVSKSLAKSFIDIHVNLFVENAINTDCVAQEINFLKYCNHYYKQGLFVFYHGKFYEIRHILRINEICYLMCMQFNVLLFDEFLYSFKIQKTSDSSISLIEYSTLKHKNVYEKKMLNDSMYIICDSLVLLNNVNNIESV